MAPTPAFHCLFALFLLFPAYSSSTDAFVKSRATYYGSPKCLGNPNGGCGYGEFGRDLNGGDVGATSILFRNGCGCGACYQVKCTIPKLCKEDGVKVVITDHGASDSADLILSAHAFAELAKPGLSDKLMAYGGVDIEYCRIPCEYPGHNMMLKVTDHSKYPDYIAIVAIYQGGKQDILAVEIWREDCKEWVQMRRAYGAVFDMANPPKGPINLRLLCGTDGGAQQYVEVKGAIPENWKAGVAYDTNMQLT